MDPVTRYLYKIMLKNIISRIDSDDSIRPVVYIQLLRRLVNHPGLELDWIDELLGKQDVKELKKVVNCQAELPKKVHLQRFRNMRNEIARIATLKYRLMDEGSFDEALAASRVHWTRTKFDNGATYEADASDVRVKDNDVKRLGRYHGTWFKLKASSHDEFLLTF